MGWSLNLMGTGNLLMTRMERGESDAEAEEGEEEEEGMR